MIINRKPYPAIKDSGVEWLGAMPAHWKVERTKSVASVLNGATPSTNNPSYWNGDILWLTPDDLGSINGVRVKSSSRKITQAGYASCGTSLAPRGSIVISTRAPIGHLAVLDQPSCVNQGCRLLVFADGVDADYIYYLLLSARKELQSLGVGTTFTELPRARLENFPLALPPLPEQTAIVRFLNHADQRIQRYIRAKQKLITLLEEQKQVIVHEAVTGRIDVRTGKPYPTYKDSGVEWLEDVPTHWEFTMVKRHYTIQLGKMLQNRPNSPDDIAVTYLKALHVQWFQVRTTDLPTMWARPSDLVQFGVTSGDLLVCEGGEGGRCGILKQGGNGYIIQNALHRVRPHTHGRNEYLQYALSTVAAIGWFAALNEKATIAHFTREKFGALRVPIPPLPEQNAIVEFLDKATAAIDTSISRTHRQIEVLQEYRIRLIADVVTGKLDVREAAAKLPETDAIDDFGGSETAQAESNASLPNNALRKDNIP